jgi:hypothetical protein
MATGHTKPPRGLKSQESGPTNIDTIISDLGFEDDVVQEGELSFDGCEVDSTIINALLGSNDCLGMELESDTALQETPDSPSGSNVSSGWSTDEDIDDETGKSNAHTIVHQASNDCVKRLLFHHAMDPFPNGHKRQRQQVVYHPKQYSHPDYQPTSSRTMQPNWSYTRAFCGHHQQQPFQHQIHYQFQQPQQSTTQYCSSIQQHQYLFCQPHSQEYQPQKQCIPQGFNPHKPNNQTQQPTSLNQNVQQVRVQQQHHRHQQHHDDDDHHQHHQHNQQKQQQQQQQQQLAHRNNQVTSNQSTNQPSAELNKMIAKAKRDLAALERRLAAGNAAVGNADGCNVAVHPESAITGPIIKQPPVC